MKRLPLFFLIFALTGCATHAKYAEYLNSWKGASEAELVDSLGIPDGTYQKDTWKYLTYYRQTGEDFCKTIFVLEEDKVIKWQASGEACVSDKTSRSD